MFQTHYFSEILVAPGIDPGTSGFVARNSDHWTTEAVNTPHNTPQISASTHNKK
jgi:hypothetical protein